MKLNAAWIDGPIPERTDKSCVELGSLPGEIVVVVAHPTSELLAAGFSDGKLVVFDTAQKTILLSIQAHDQPITSVLFTPDGQHIATASGDGTTTVWNGTGEAINTMIAGSAILGLSYEPNTKRIAFAGMDRHAAIWRPFEDAKLYSLPKQNAPATSCRWLDEKILLVGDAVGFTWVWNVDLGVMLKRLKGHDQQVTQIVASPKGDWYATGSWDGCVRLRSKSHRERGEFRREGQPVTSLNLSNDGKLLIVGHWDGGVRVWDVEKGKLVDEFAACTQAMSSAAVSSDGQSYLTAENSGNLRAWSLATFGIVQFVHRHSGEVYGLTYTPDNVNLLSAGWDGCLRLWDRQNCAEVGYVQAFEGPATSVAAAQDNATWAVGGADGVVRFWDVAQQSFEISFPAHRLTSSCVRFLPSSDHAVVGSWNNRLSLCAIRGQFVECSFDGHSKEVNSCDVSADGRRMASTSNDGTIRIWSLEYASDHAKALLTLGGHQGPVNDCAFSPDGRMAASASSDRTVRVWSSEDQVDPVVLDGHDDETTAVRFTPDGRWILSADRSGKVYFWDAAEFVLLGTIQHDNPILCLAVAPDGLQAAIGDSKGFVRFFDIEYETGPLWTTACTEFQRPGLWRFGSQPIERYRVSCLFCDASELVDRRKLGKAWECPKCHAAVNLCPEPQSAGVRSY